MKSIEPGKVGGRLSAPPSKSSTQRAIACALLAASAGAEESIIARPGRSADCLAALGLAAELAEALGGKAEDRGDQLVIRGVGGALAETEPRGSAARTAPRELSCGESGLALRMFSPVAALFPGSWRLLASGSLRKRPVSMIEAPLRELGVEVTTEGGLPPVTLSGPLTGGSARVDGSESSQFLTGLLVALPLAGRDSRLEVVRLASSGYVDLTIATMKAFGVEVREETKGERRVYSIEGRRRYRPTRFFVEGDWSGAAFPLVAAAIAGLPAGLVVANVPRDSTQPDRAIVHALGLAGADISQGESSVVVRPGSLRGFSFDATDCPDLFPPLVALASRCVGETRLRGARRLRAKESDRAAALAQGFGALGIGVEVDDDLMVIRGGTIRGGTVDSKGDHRIAMAAAVAALAADGPVSIEDPECVAKSWPEFYEAMESVTARRA